MHFVTFFFFFVVNMHFVTSETVEEMDKKIVQTLINKKIAQIGSNK